MPAAELFLEAAVHALNVPIDFEGLPAPVQEIRVTTEKYRAWHELEIHI